MKRRSTKLCIICTITSLFSANLFDFFNNCTPATAIPAPKLNLKKHSSVMVLVVIFALVQILVVVVVVVVVVVAVVLIVLLVLI